MEKIIKTVIRKGDVFNHNLGNGRADNYKVAGRWEGNIVLAPRNKTNSIVMIYTDYEMRELQENGKLSYQMK